MKGQAFSIDLLVAIFLLVSLCLVVFSWQYLDVSFIKAYDFAAIVHKGDFKNETWLSHLSDEYNISIVISCENYTYSSLKNSRLYVKRVIWYNGRICNLSVGV